MYGTEGVSGESGNLIFPVGVNECFFKEATFASAKKDNSGDNVLTFHFVDDKGAEINFKAWEVIPDKSKGLAGKLHLSSRTLTLGDKKFEFVKDKTITENESIAINFERFNKIIKHVTNRFDSELVIPTAKSYADFCKNIIKLLEPHKGKKVKLATQYKGQYVNIKSTIPFLADVTDNKTLENLKLNLVKEEPTPTQEERSDEWS
ncbi:MAG: hypothetical protein ACRCRZ_03230 [Metamycoplasmataceae bacterium]